MQWLQSEIPKVLTVILLAAGLFAAVFVFLIFARAKSLVALVVALVTAGIFLWGIANVRWFEQQIQQETGGAGGIMLPPSRLYELPGRPR